MNKLDVAVSLLQLLNERKSIDTKLVANELQVSLRTAQRYLLELSRMPCVIYNESDRSYSLDNSYKIKEALVNGNNRNVNVLRSNAYRIHNANNMMCLICGNNRDHFNTMPSFCNINNILSNKFVLDKLVSLIKKKLDCHKCSFP